MQVLEKAHGRRGRAARELGQLALAADAYVAALEATAVLRRQPRLPNALRKRLEATARETGEKLREVRALETTKILASDPAHAETAEDKQLLEAKTRGGRVFFRDCVFAAASSPRSADDEK